MKRHEYHKAKRSRNWEPEEIRNEYIEDLQKWTDNRYNPGFYTEGNIPPDIKYAKRPTGLLLIFFGLLSLILGYAIRLQGNFLFTLVVFIASVVQLVAGLLIVFKINKT